MEDEYGELSRMEIPWGRLQPGEGNVTVRDSLDYFSPLGPVGGGKHLGISRRRAGGKMPSFNE